MNGGVLIASSGRYSSNSAVGTGGAIQGYEASMRFEEVDFSDNASLRSGGAIALNRSITQLAGTIFEENVATNGDALFIADDLDPEIDGTDVYCDPSAVVSFCYGFDDGSAIYEVPGGLNVNTNCREVGLSDLFSQSCPNYKP